MYLTSYFILRCAKVCCTSMRRESHLAVLPLHGPYPSGWPLACHIACCSSCISTGSHLHLESHLPLKLAGHYCTYVSGGQLIPMTHPEDPADLPAPSDGPVLPAICSACCAPCNPPGHVSPISSANMSRRECAVLCCSLATSLPMLAWCACQSSVRSKLWLASMSVIWWRE